MNFEDYQAPSPAVESVHPYWIEAFVADLSPRAGQALAIHSEQGEVVYAEVSALVGARRVQALLPAMPSWMRPGLEVAVIEQPIGFALPLDDDLHLGSALFVPHQSGPTLALRGERPAMMDLDGERPVVSSGAPGIDLFSPVAGRGFNLVIDVSSTLEKFEGLVARVGEEVKPSTTIVVGIDFSGPGRVGRVHFEGGPAVQLMALRVGMRWAAHLRDEGEQVFFVAALPGIEESGETRQPGKAMPGMGEVIDLMGSGLVSTAGASITSMIRLPMKAHRDGLAHIIETLDLGAVDSQIFIDETGRFEPTRSFSRAEVDPQVQARAGQLLAGVHRIRERLQLFGEDDVESEEMEVLEQMERYRKL